jgi:hypothetical protein
MMACASGGWRAMISSVIPSDRPWFLPNTALPVQISLPKKSLQAVNGYEIVSQHSTMGKSTFQSRR